MHSQRQASHAGFLTQSRLLNRVRDHGGHYRKSNTLFALNCGLMNYCETQGCRSRLPYLIPLRAPVDGPIRDANGLDYLVGVVFVHDCLY